MREAHFFHIRTPDGIVHNELTRMVTDRRVALDKDSSAYEAADGGWLVFRRAKDKEVVFWDMTTLSPLTAEGRAAIVTMLLMEAAA